ncbi:MULTISPECIES: MotE family protein [Pelosinus]|uniref:MgtE intracellular region n=1 Tax=Pelosinus fermentans B4 TaxID=1149862 RepID=I9LCZ0_9FIRM|nr:MULTISPECIES: hypothetical protein [Pelosinus]EIW18211.1 MgtE intracellular region [Pelosinus fermentans B4]EIW24015.1 MgtE intracellular region [Pelosinus fermentans A11]OAM94057.1 hypothetical protein FR7_02075 [Pelosinus fermentans DSM 17108]SDQ98548.1 hypothetical protein SAMN04515679_2167 [Pelosinus fermentans]
MAKKVTPNSQIKINMSTPEKPKKKLGTIVKVLIAIIILLFIAVAGFALGVYLNLIDMKGMTEKWKLNEYPVIGQYFPQPKTNFETVELEEQNQVETPTEANLVVPPAAVPNLSPAVSAIVDDSELQKQTKIRQQEEAKRISKLARLYGGMKPGEAVVILNQLDDPSVLAILNKMEDEQVSKILPLFSPERAAILTQAMLRGGNLN